MNTPKASPTPTAADPASWRRWASQYDKEGQPIAAHNARHTADLLEAQSALVGELVEGQREQVRALESAHAMLNGYGASEESRKVGAKVQAALYRARALLNRKEG